MRWLQRIAVIIILVIVVSATVFIQRLLDPTEHNKQLVQAAIIYAIETYDPQQDYSKYVASNLMAHVNGEIFNYQQWVTHMQRLKAATKSMSVAFKEIVVNKNAVSVNYSVHLVKQDGSTADIKVIEMYWLHNGKIVYSDGLSEKQ